MAKSSIEKIMMLSTILVIVVAFNVAYSKAEVVRNISCDFNNGHFCNYTLSGPEGAWEINHGGDERRFMSPLSPFEGSLGFVDLIDDRAGLDSPQIRLQGQYCFSVDYYLIGVSLSQLTIYAKPINAAPGGNNFHRFEQNSYLLFVLNNIRSITDEWQHYKATVEFRDDVYQILINGAANQDVGREFVAFDNLKFEEGPCQIVETDVKKCNFDHVVRSAHPENPQCEWLAIINSPDSDYEHRARVTRDDEDLIDGYQHDHTTHTALGGFIFVNGSQNPAQLRLPTFTPEMGRHCLSFAARQPAVHDSFYYQVIETEVNSGRESVLLEYDHRNLNSSTFPYWIKQYVNINPVQPINVTLQVLGERLLLDSFQLARGSCPNNIDCDFRINACDWTLGDYWNVGRGRLGSLSDNPDVDYEHNYLYHDFRAKPGHQMRFIYSDWVSAGEYCFKYVFKKQNGTAVSITTGIGGRPAQEQRTESEGEWEVKYVNIDKPEQFRIVMELRARGYEGRNVRIFKLRQVSLIDGPCE